MNKVVVICGPTGIGKTRFAIQVSQEFNGEIISADSMQVYKFLDIGTAKPDARELAAARHHLVDFLDPKQDFDAGMYVNAADKAIKDIVNSGRLPIVAGGTGLYIKALIHGLFRSYPVNARVIEKYMKQVQEKGPEHLHERLTQCDPESAQKIHAHDTFRVVRALEIFETNGVRMSACQKEHQFGQKRYETLKIGLHMDRKILYERINRRVDVMIQQGLYEEVLHLIENGYSPDLKSMQSIGYKHMALYIKGIVDWDEAVRLLKRDSRRYAKRQFTWFNKDTDIHWLGHDRFDTASDLIKEFLTS
ncbi:MAG: tRNA (adenosine(37)-N6)-dimethylallyltransferase MiaA [Proteobacteria bacterium]|nr:tRNA (adenosine(37)-N6)-dimethylallyltransferase MiaA [Pseudomonadota bacterium]MBU1386565.1 tRNA (adenosine(37)-N6)-dimethylallyltransferase MiaA [Pseudomonadota bacterium]MBU1542466.1 tRNA (adenosine(37)-N6)-dimethylallyltransferase MiaA [Pseudomonadota bacterium]MBU2430583.1 tRNA (adenosine(37)-N6)-dimethylallyltransferase MiaA [Pseudomonadota bacterium]MBU2482929.1 tRNA (adenosine(37)-N6)-dimethylallyltransferase MiaA [Pseudomonadota bacterium]